MSEHLVAKAKLSPVKSTGERKLKSVVVARRIKLIDRLRLNKPIRRQLSQKSQGKKGGVRPQPKVTPEQRRKVQVAEESDQDILTVTEDVDIDGATERGKLLRQSTLKPAISAQKTIREPDPEPANSTSTVKRVVRIVHRPHEPNTLDVTVVPKTRSIGIQVGLPSRELDKRRDILPVVAPQQEPPLKSYWTHRVNLPYPPTQTHERQAILSGQHVQQPQQYQYYQQQYVPTLPFPQQQQQFMQAGPFMQPVVQHQLPPTRRQKRNFIKHQKYLQRKHL